MNLNDLDDSSELDARELAFGEKFQYPTYRGAPRGTISADAEVLESLNLLKNLENVEDSSSCMQDHR